MGGHSASLDVPELKPSQGSLGGHHEDGWPQDDAFIRTRHQGWWEALEDQ